MAKKKIAPVTDEELIAPLTDEELIAPLPAVAVDIGGALAKPSFNFAAQKEFLAVRINQVLSEELTEKNLERVKTLKKGVVSWRTSFEKETKAYMDAQFKAPMNVFKAAASEVLADIDKMETSLDEILDKEEEKRIDNINTLLDGLEEELQEQFSLPEEYKSRVERKKGYYNKTAVMSDVAADLKAQYETLAKELVTRAKAEKTVKSMCSSDKRLNVDMYIRHLDTTDLADVIEEINAEKDRLAAIDNPKEEVRKVEAEPVETVKADNDGVVRIGVKPNKELLKSDFPGLTKTMTMQITYPVDSGDELTRIFTEIQKSGIKIKVINCVENVPNIPAF